MTDIEWRDIPGYEGLYRVSNTGQVMRLVSNPGRGSKPGLLKQQSQKPTNKHPIVQLYKDGKQRQVEVYKVVALAFKPKPGDNYRIRHRDNNPDNNHVDNLLWVYGKGLAKSDSKRRANNLVNRRAILYLASQGVARTLLARAYGMTTGAITHMVERDKKRQARPDQSPAQSPDNGEAAKEPA